MSADTVAEEGVKEQREAAHFLLPHTRDLSH